MSRLKKRNIILFPSVFSAVFLLFLGSVQYVGATSGACSSHGGVNCQIGPQANGKVYCNDPGWTDSIVGYDLMSMCQKSGEDWEEFLILEYMKDKRMFTPKYENALYDKDIHDELDEKCKSTMYKNLTPIARLNACFDWVLQQEKEISSKPICPKHSTIEHFVLKNIDKCLCDEGYYNYNPANPTAIDFSIEVCVKGNPPFRIDKYTQGIDQSNAIGWPPDLCKGVFKDGMCIPNAAVTVITPVPVIKEGQVKDTVPPEVENKKIPIASEQLIVGNTDSIKNLPEQKGVFSKLWVWFTGLFGS